MLMKSLDTESLARGIQRSDADFRKEVIYFLVVDRFFRAGDAPLPDDDCTDSTRTDWDKFWGGNLRGVLEKLDYLRASGVTAIWLTPLFEQVIGLEDGSDRAPIHGYWTRDFKRIDPRWLDDSGQASLFQCKHTLFDELLEECHRRGIKLILDVVCNHSSPATSDGKGKLYDDGRLIADFNNDESHWYHHYGEVVDWEDEWQVQHCEVAGLATFNEENVEYRRYIKEAIKLWLGRGVDALRLDTVKHMPLWFWQEFNSEMHAHKPDVFLFGEWIDGHPNVVRTVEYANKAGMSLLDFGFCHALRKCLGEDDPRGFELVQDLLKLDGRYRSATELVTFFENHDMPRLLTLKSDRKSLHLALVLLLLSRGIPCVFYGAEQYLYSNNEGGGDPYNRPIMECWNETEARRLIRVLGDARLHNKALQFGGQWPILVRPDLYAFERRFGKWKCLVLLNRGGPSSVKLEHLTLEDGGHKCRLTGHEIFIRGGVAELQVPDRAAFVWLQDGLDNAGSATVRLQLNNVPAEPGDRVAVLGDCEELGGWDVRYAVPMECVNSNTWFAEIALGASTGPLLRYKYVLYKSENISVPLRESTIPRERTVPSDGVVKWRDLWDE
jgi:cyclomaltodextrin glucanotransferase